MKKIFKQTGVALSIALLSSGFVMAQETEKSTEEVQVLDTPAIEVVEMQVNETPSAVVTPNVEEVKPAAKPVKKDKVRKPTPKEINMVSKGNYVAPLNLSVNGNNQMMNAVSVDGLHVVPIVKIPELNSSENYYQPLSITVEFPFKDAHGNNAPEGALISNNGKNLKIYHFTSDFSRMNVKEINAETDVYSSTHNRRECDVILYQYQISDDSEKAVEAIYLNKGRVSDKQGKKGCKTQEVNKHETSLIDDNGYFINVTYKKPVAVEGKNQDFSIISVKDGKNVQLINPQVHILSNNHDFVKTVKGVNSGSQTAFNNLELQAGDYTFVIEYTVGGKTGTMVLQKSVRK